MKSQRVWIASALLCAAIGVAGIGFMLSSIGKGHQLLHAAMDGDPAQILRELQRHPDDPVLWSYLGGAYAGTRRYDDAQRRIVVLWPSTRPRPRCGGCSASPKSVDRTRRASARYKPSLTRSTTRVGASIGVLRRRVAVRLVVAQPATLSRRITTSIWTLPVK